MSKIRLLVKKIGENNKELFNVYLKNFSSDIIFNPLFRYCSIMDSFLWFTLINEKNEIIGECSVSNRHNVGKKLFVKTFEFHDVFIQEKFRGNNYAELMILNVLAYLDEHFGYYNYIIKTSGTNLPAIKTYYKICGQPIFKNGLAIFKYNQSFASTIIQ